MHRYGAGERLFVLASVVLVGVSSLLLLPMPHPVPPQTAASGTGSLSVNGGSPASSHPQALHPASRAKTLSGGYFYTQEGATLAQLNDSGAIAGAHTLSLALKLVTSPYPVGYELNGLSDSGDWYQVVVTDNWPGCASGFEEVTEVWGVGDISGPVNCDPTLSLSQGDSVQLGLNFTASREVCLDVRDLTTAASHSLCQAQPDAGGSVFSVIGGVANVDGYFTGPMTEVVNGTASACPDYLSMPRLDYRAPSGTWVSQYTPWSDEWEYGGTGTFCYSGGGSTTTLGPNDPTTQYVDTASGTGYGPHWAAGQNFSHFDSTVGWRFQTDPNPITSAVMTSDRVTVGVGTPVHLGVTVGGGTSPYSALWFVNGSLQSTTALNYTFTPSALGNYPITADGVDALENALAPAAPITIVVTGPLTVPPILASPGSGGIDVGQPVVFQVNPTGGIGPRTYVWSSLPSGCLGTNASRLTCTPLGPGLFNVTVRVTDSNNSTVFSPVLPYRVYLQPLATLTASVTQLDVGQSTDLEVGVTGGASPYSYAWTGTPSGCPAPAGPSLVCSPVAGGTWVVQVTVTDANGGLSVVGSVTLVVHPSPRVTLNVDRTTAEAGQPVTFSASAVGGTGIYTYTWTGLPFGCPGPNQSRITCTPVTRAGLNITVQVTDTFGVAALSNVASVLEYPALTVHLAVSPTSASTGTVVSFGATASGGSGPLRYPWTGVPAGCYAPPNASFDCQLTDSGTFPITIHVWDGLGGNATSNATLTVTGLPAGPALGGLGPVGLIGLGIGAALVILAVALVLARRRGRESPPPPD